MMKISSKSTGHTCTVEYDKRSEVDLQGIPLKNKKNAPKILPQGWCGNESTMREVRKSINETHESPIFTQRYHL